MAEGLSDVLRDMASGKTPPPGTPGSDPPQPPMHAARRLERPRGAEDELVPAEVDDESCEVLGEAPAPAPRRRPAPRRPAQADHGLKAASVPVLATVGLLLMALAVWGTLVLMGVEVWRSDQPGARNMALAMLAGYPVGLCLLGGAALFFTQLQRAKRPR